MALKPEILKHQPADSSFAEDARCFVPDEKLVTAIETIVAVGEPLLLTGEPGTGKTQAAYYAAYALDIEPVIHFQVKSESTARDLLYHFDTVQYFHDAHFQRVRDDDAGGELDKGEYVEERPLWEAFGRCDETGKPAVLLIDEIDKAPRDFPNDLLHELDRMEFTIAETRTVIRRKSRIRPLVFITSNSERRLPEPFLRRCVYHHIRFDDNLVFDAVNAHMGRYPEFKQLNPQLLKLAIRRFLDLRGQDALRKKPATGELLVWLRMLALAAGVNASTLEQQLKTRDLSALPYLGMLLKDHQDMEEVVGDFP
uniref:MoxR-like ATPase n=1 Tax=Candidatus Kentrum sp. FM TaxID=2126340 RepID=A0A450SAZ8_9GAMM|nr:MAG: MoxR-like ATPase [Candidatus Kentron sp. FM]VFJ49343.1 MAG: MoxR-like ATPase [Candidatus Kentron sp. FM]VFK08257.1 MAG: MoxR-like ATPase [Candidatus Kentron sp. FM]